MATVLDYTFDKMTRNGNDKCYKSQSAIQNDDAFKYLTQNYFAAENCTMQTPIELATSQPGIFYYGNHGATDGCNIDQNSKLTIGTIQTHPKCHIDLFQRPFATVPFLGKGVVNPDIESQIKQGETISNNKKSINNIGEKSYINYQHTPLLDNVKNNNNLKHKNVGARGGIASRELTRDT